MYSPEPTAAHVPEESRKSTAATGREAMRGAPRASGIAASTRAKHRPRARNRRDRERRPPPTRADLLFAGSRAGSERAEAPLCIGTASDEAIGRRVYFSGNGHRRSRATGTSVVSRHQSSVLRRRRGTLRSCDCVRRERVVRRQRSARSRRRQSRWCAPTAARALKRSHGTSESHDRSRRMPSSRYAVLAAGSGDRSVASR